MIRVEAVSHSYNGEPVLDGVSFEVQEGERVVLLGSNGSGKTTLLRILDGLVFPREGVCTYRNTPITRSSLRRPPLAGRFRREVTLLFQNPESMLFNPTVYDEIAHGPRQVARGDVDEVVRHWAALFGLTALLDRPPFELSKGQIQKVCLAGLLALQPRLLLLDEPTASLDPRSTGWLIDFLQELDVTTVTTTHNLSMAAELGDRTLVLSEDHRLIHDGPVGEVVGNTDLLLEANLVHVHRHRHGDVEHRHYHSHDWD